MPIAGLLNYIAGTAKQPVVDMTGSRASYDFTIDLTPPGNAIETPDGRPGQIDLFTQLREAVEDQLGLKLEPQKVAVENLVIEKVERPSKN